PITRSPDEPIGLGHPSSSGCSLKSSNPNDGAHAMTVLTPHAHTGAETDTEAVALHGFAINTAPASVTLPEGFADFYAPLHARFTPWQQELAGKRKDALRNALESIRSQVSAEKRGANMG